MSDVKSFPIEMLRKMVCGYGNGKKPVVKEKVGEAHGMPDSNLIEEYRLVFKDGKDFWQVTYHQMCSYYMSEVGEECEPFEYAPIKDENFEDGTRVRVDCTRVYKVIVMEPVTRYLPTPAQVP